MKLEHSNITLFGTTSSVITSDAEAREIIMEDLTSIGDSTDHDGGDGDVNMHVVACVLLEMALSFLGILTNLLGKYKAQIKVK